MSTLNNKMKKGNEKMAGGNYSLFEDLLERYELSLRITFILGVIISFFIIILTILSLIFVVILEFYEKCKCCKKCCIIFLPIYCLFNMIFYIFFAFNAN